MLRSSVAWRGAPRCCRRSAPISPKARGFARRRVWSGLQLSLTRRRTSRRPNRPTATRSVRCLRPPHLPLPLPIRKLPSSHRRYRLISPRSCATRGATPPDIRLPADVRVMAANLLLDIAWTHVTARVRQTLVGMAGVAMGVGFTIMMAGLMQGSQIDFLRQLVDTMPHVTVQDERRTPPPQPADQEYGAVQMSSVANVNNRPGIRYPESVMASLRSWIPGDVAP